MKLSEYLASLGNTSEEVAASLQADNVKGVMGSKCHCPILNAIYKNCEPWSGLQIVNGSKGKDGNWRYVATYNDFQIMDPQLPQAVMNFIGEFDHGKYPDLVTKSVKEVTTRVWE